jgi:hypothetical protein
MASQNLLTTFGKVIQTEVFYYYPNITYPGNQNVNLYSMYCFLGKVDPWPDDLNPPKPKQDQKSIKDTYKNMFALKRITSNDISPVIIRRDWVQGITYDFYQDTVDMFETDENGILIKNFYIKNSFDQVFKCLWNNNNQPSTIEPYFQPGTYNSNNIFQGADGYKWKFMFSVDQGLKNLFMDDSWIPLPVGVFAPGAEVENLSSGDIEVINVTNGGQGYDPANAAIIVTVTGDGTGATGTAVVNTASGMITDVIVTNVGEDYTFANVSITSTSGSGATAIAPISPVGGHGSDPTSELNAVYNMVVCEFNASENGYIPTDIEYYQVGLLINPSDLTTNPYPAKNDIYALSSNMVVAPGFGDYVFDETVYQGNVNSPTFTATVLSFNASINTLYLINITGTPNLNSPVYSSVSGTTRTLLNYNTPNYIPYSGYIGYIENRSGIQRSDDGIEQFKFVLGY